MRRTHHRQPQTSLGTIATPHAPSALRAIALVVALGTSVGCADAHRETMGVAAPGEAATIVWGSVAWAGGVVSRTETRVDSATKRFEFRWCRGEGIGMDCDLNANVSRGAAYEPALAELFRLQNTSAFRALRSSYGSPSRVPPPDPSFSWLDVTANERYRRISWDGTAPLPAIVFELTCAMLSARGSLTLCD